MFEFFKNALADIGLRLMDSTGGFSHPIAVVRYNGFVWKNGVPFEENEVIRHPDALRQPRWMKEARSNFAADRKARKRAQWRLQGMK